MSKEEKTMPRRKFLQIGIGGLGAAIGLSYVGLAGDFLLPAAASAQLLQEVGKISDFPVGVPKLMIYKGSGVEEGMYVTNLGDEGWLALDFHCTHLQCAVNFEPALQQYMCPCHGGVYDLKGNVLSGPPPKPLIRRVVKVQGDSVFLGGRLT
ncbi:ubiquinol-cytochrome c reductase iron-sulfur subunit [Desulfosporosinus sp. SB140]|uniref:QcrA and Rieske domain-containing protein n=1 Tax=Desulfosporosinus paludis TaxID=3115649 RepID=UPI00388DAC69